MACRDVWNTWHKGLRSPTDGEAGGFCGDQRPEGDVFHTSRQAMIKTFYSTSIRKIMVQNWSYFTQMKSTTTAIDDGTSLGLAVLGKQQHP